MFLNKCFLLLLQLAALSELQAQLCNGSLGDPIINITFGAGANPGKPLTTTTNLTYRSSDCPDDGYYTVRSNTNQCFGNTWHTVNSDHTGDPDGYFMLINASFQKSEFYIDTIRGLCPNTTYEYAAWLMNVALPSTCMGNPINPNLTFNIEKIDGTILQTYSTGDIMTTSSPVWKQYGFFFATPANASVVVVRIINNSYGGCGNDLAIDDITFRPCGPEIISYIKGEDGIIKDLCEGDDSEVTLSCHVSEAYNNPSYQWQQSKDNGITYVDIPGATDTSFIEKITENTSAGNYLYRLSIGEQTNSNMPSCRTASGVLTIRVNGKPIVKAQSNSPVCEGAPIILIAQGGSEYVWTGVNLFSGLGASVSISNAQINSSGYYYVTVTTNGKCQQKDSTHVDIIPGPDATTNFASQTICQGDSVLLNSSGGGSYFWSPSDGLSSAFIANPMAKPFVTTLYKVVVQNETLCTDTAAVTINVIIKPEAEAGPDINIVEGQSSQILATAIGTNVSYNWTPGINISNAHILQPFVNPANDIVYQLTVSSNDGCGYSQDSVRIHVFKKVIIPNAFSPNNDGINDTWNIKALNTYTDYELSVFNRYGRLVFFTKDYSKPWDGSYNGKNLTSGTYYYLLNLKQHLPMLKGYVVILR